MKKPKKKKQWETKLRSTVTRFNSTFWHKDKKYEANKRACRGKNWQALSFITEGLI
jgi:hypothetical protein